MMRPSANELDSPLCHGAASRSSTFGRRSSLSHGRSLEVPPEQFICLIHLLRITGGNKLQVLPGEHEVPAAMVQMIARDVHG